MPMGFRQRFGDDSHEEQRVGQGQPALLEDVPEVFAVQPFHGEERAPREGPALRPGRRWGGLTLVREYDRSACAPYIHEPPRMTKDGRSPPRVLCGLCEGPFW